MKIGFDFDDVLTNEKILDFAKLLNLHSELFIITSRFEEKWNIDLQSVKKALSLPSKKVTAIFLGGTGKTKAEMINELGIDLFFEDCPVECEQINENSNALCLLVLVDVETFMNKF